MGAVSSLQDLSKQLEGLIYLDYNATTPIDPDVAEAMLPFIRTEFGNPSSGHLYGQRAKAAINAAREAVAALIGSKAQEVFFTSGGTESNNWAIKGAARALRSHGNHLVTTSIEHPAISQVVDHLREEEGFEVTTVGADSEGVVDVEAVVEAAKEGTTVVTIMLANNEVGSLQPVAEIARRLKGRGIVVHTDASQAVGKIPVSWEELGVDLLTIAGHKLYAPKGVGALVVREGTPLQKFMHGASHERGFRAGTENVILIAGLGKACEVAREVLPSTISHTRAMRERLLSNLKQSLDARHLTDGRWIKMRINGPDDPEKHLPNTLSVSFAGLNGTELLEAILPQVACSAGSACHAGHVSLSPTLAAMGVPYDFAKCTLRLSVGRDTRVDDVDKAAEIIMKVLHKMYSDLAAID